MPWHLLAPLAHPPHLSLCLLALAALALLPGWRAVAALMAGAGLAWSLLWSLPVAADGLTRSLERRHPALDAATLPRADAIVVLGGATGAADWFEPGDPDSARLATSRVATAARVWQAGRAPLVLLSGGNLRDGVGEAQAMARAIARLGVPASALLLETRSRDTRDNARHAAALLHDRGARHVLLVTSAMHMPRAVLLFERQGLRVTPVATASETAAGGAPPPRWQPNASALRRSGRALKEYAGLCIAALSAWRNPRQSHARGSAS